MGGTKNSLNLKMLFKLKCLGDALDGITVKFQLPINCCAMVEIQDKKNYSYVSQKVSAENI